MSPRRLPRLAQSLLAGVVVLAGAMIASTGGSHAEGQPVALDRSTLTVRRGMLECTAGGDTCMVANMPLVSQSDRRINTVLDDYLTQYPDDKLPHNGKGVQMTRVEARQAMKAGGCYDTSIITVAAAALANRAPQLSVLQHRTRTFFDLRPVTDAKGQEIPREVNMVAWQYYQALRGHNKVQEGGKAVQPLYFHEIVADIGGGKVREACDPYVYGSCSTANAANGLASAFRTFHPVADKVADPELIKLMRPGYVLLLAYERMEPVTTYDKATKTLHVTFKNINNHHKVAVSGFRGGSFPLLINNVGNAKLEAATIASDLGKLRFEAANAGETPKKIVFDPKFAGKPFVMFEGPQQTNALVLFLAHYDGLRVAASPGRTAQR
jgi:hypothetical protein